MSKRKRQTKQCLKEGQTKQCLKEGQTKQCLKEKGQKDKQRSTNIAHKTKRLSNTNPTKNRRWTHVIRDGRQFRSTKWLTCLSKNKREHVFLNKYHLCFIPCSCGLKWYSKMNNEYLFHLFHLHLVQNIQMVVLCPFY